MSAIEPTAKDIAVGIQQDILARSDSLVARTAESDVRKRLSEALFWCIGGLGAFVRDAEMHGGAAAAGSEKTERAVQDLIDRYRTLARSAPHGSVDVGVAATILNAQAYLLVDARNADGLERCEEIWALLNDAKEAHGISEWGRLDMAGVLGKISWRLQRDSVCDTSKHRELVDRFSSLLAETGDARSEAKIRSYLREALVACESVCDSLAGCEAHVDDLVNSIEADFAQETNSQAKDVLFLLMVASLELDSSELARSVAHRALVDRVITKHQLQEFCAMNGAYFSYKIAQYCLRSKLQLLPVLERLLESIASISDQSEVGSQFAQSVASNLPGEDWDPGACAGLEGFFERQVRDRNADAAAHAAALVSLWAQRAVTGNLPSAVDRIVTAWSADDVPPPPALKTAALRGAAMAASLIKPGDKLLERLWKIVRGGRSAGVFGDPADVGDKLETRIHDFDDAVVEATVAIARKADMEGRDLTEFIREPERAMNFGSATELDRRIAYLLDERIERLVRSDINAAMDCLEQIRELHARSKSVTLRPSLAAILDAMEPNDPRREALEEEHSEIPAGGQGQTELVMSYDGPSREDELRTELAERLSKDVVWPFEPLIDGAWRDLDEAETIVAADRAVRALPLDHLVERLCGVRQMTLACYPGCALHEFLLRGEDDDQSSMLALLGPDSAVRLSGESPPIHALNAKGAISLDTADKAIEYLRLFCSAVQGDEGPFMLVRSEEDVAQLLQEGASLPDPLPPIQPVRIDMEETFKDADLDDSGADVPEWFLEGTVLYAKALFKARFKITLSGLVEMLDDEPLVANLPVHTVSIRNGERSFVE